MIEFLKNIWYIIRLFLFGGIILILNLKNLSELEDNPEDDMYRLLYYYVMVVALIINILVITTLYYLLK